MSSENEKRGSASELNELLCELDPRIGEGEKIANELWRVYRSGYDEFAGPSKFRHACNFDDYHRAGLLAVYTHLTSTNGTDA